MRLTRTRCNTVLFLYWRSRAWPSTVEGSWAITHPGSFLHSLTTNALAFWPGWPLGPTSVYCGYIEKIHSNKITWKCCINLILGRQSKLKMTAPCTLVLYQVKMNRITNYMLQYESLFMSVDCAKYKSLFFSVTWLLTMLSNKS